MGAVMQTQHSAREESNKGPATPDRTTFSAPSISLPKGGGAIRGIGEKFAANPVTGTGSMSVPIATSPGRSGFGPQLSLSYDSGSGNGPFGFGWSLSIPAITRKTDKGLPQYRDADESDVFILSGAEDLVPVLIEKADGHWEQEQLPPRTINGKTYRIQHYRPRIEGLFARIERWTRSGDGDVHWRSVSKDNILTIYGRDEHSRIADPNDTSRIFSWLICESYDDKGNAIVYEYTSEDDVGIDRTQANEQNRVRSANRYLKRIKYGNRQPLLLDTSVAGFRKPHIPQPDFANANWMFEVVFDYDEAHHQIASLSGADATYVNASLDPPGHWTVRKDPFSTYRAGFEVRSYRLCRRVLMFHLFPQELGINDCLVRSTDFSYSESPIASFITGVTQSGYVRQPTQNEPNWYLKKSLPPLEFEYSQVPSPEQLAQQPIREVDPDSLENLPVGLDGVSYQWMDLDGEGTSGILTEQADGWYYKRNLSANHQVTENKHEHTVAWFGPTEIVAKKPASGLAGGAQFLDLAGDGQVDLVQMEGSVRGFYERTDDANWLPFQPFNSWPDLNTHDPDLKFVDLTGDGHADILITEGAALTWYSSLAEEGYAPADRVSLPSDEEKGPRLVFADGEQSIYLADLSGDGLSDLVRIRNGEVCYWPNLGYGHFGPKVTMDHAPWFDAPDQFDQRRIRLADTDGSGTTDILYLRRDGVQIFFNQSGNGWSDPVVLPQFPPIDNIASVQALDLLGNGTACLVWSSPLPSNIRQPMRYLALMEEKPHLLVGVKNNLGAETKVHYAPSTKFYLDDKQNGKPWITRLPFPVHVVERVETYDYLSRNHFVTGYAYHHGYFDGVEREFRGFGMVEQWDTDEFNRLDQSAKNVDASWYMSPVHTKTWFHTGAYFRGKEISLHLAHEYFGAPQDKTAFQVWARDNLLDDTVLPDVSLNADENREACRALKGAMLRQEVYADDNSAEADMPYTVTEQNFTIELLQPQADNRHAVFFTHAREAISYHYERKPADPRIGHVLNLDVDKYGNVLKTFSISYGRRHGQSPLSGNDIDKQEQLLITYTENDVTKPIDDPAKYPDDYRTPLSSEVRTYEVTGFTPGGGAVRFSFEEFADNNFQFLLALPEIGYEQPTSYAKKQKRLIEHVRTLYRKNDLTGFSPLGTAESLALPGENYTLAFTSNLLKTIFTDIGQLSPNDVNNVFGTDGGYMHSEGDANWWIPSGKVFYSPTPDDLPASELAFARAHFFLPHRYRDPFGNEVVVAYDGDATMLSRNHNLLLVETKDALGNLVTVKTQDDNGNIAICNDYRVLQPYWVTDPNGNRVQVTFDVLGMVVATAVMGKPGENQGDNLINFEADLTQTQIDAFHDALDPHALAATLLEDASTRIIYDLHRFYRSQRAHPDDSTQWEPPYAATLARETHASDPLPPQGLKIQINFSYSDGFGREIQKKIQAEPGEVEVEDATGKNIIVVDTTPNLRWVGSGWTIFNNKGKPVRQYEPFFSTHHRFQFGKKVGVSPILFYDPVERVVATLHPNHTWEKVVFDPWQQTTYDVNDTVTLDPKADPDVSAFFERLPNEDYTLTWYQRRIDGAMGADEKSAATKAAVHANTPTVAYFDTLGRTFLTFANNGKDASGNDQFYKTRIILDIEGNQREVIDAKGRVVMRYDYDMLGNRVHQASMEAGERWTLNDVTGKPIRTWNSRGFIRRMTYDELRRPTGLFVTENGSERLAEQTIYGELQGDTKNHRTRVYKVFDGAGIVTSESYDFNGNLLLSRRDLLPDYQHVVDWNQNPTPNGGAFTSSTEYDALNRPTQLVAPHSDQPGTKVNVIEPIYNEANLLEQMHAWLNENAEPTGWLDPAIASLHAVTNIDYNAKGQRTLIAYGNGATTTYDYDPLTYRLINLKTTRPTGLNGLASQLFANPAIVQDLYYTYDPTGNITNIVDKAIPIIQFGGQQAEPSSNYIYDAIYRLIFAQGREHSGQTAFDFNPPDGSYRDYPFVGLRASSNDPTAFRNFTETYDYDEVGNFKSVGHSALNGSWTRGYTYDETSLLEAGKKSNRLTSTSIGGSPEGSFTYDEHGSMKTMPHLPLMLWDYRDELQATSQQVVNDGRGETTYYTYDSTGQRVRKVTVKPQSQQELDAEVPPTRLKERIYLGGLEVYREYDVDGTTVTLERETLHIMDDKQRIALVETRTQGNDPAPQQLVRYQFSNHLGSASLELDDQAQIISYEEYTPYGGTSYQAVRSQTETPKRYRYTGKERDEESGLHYHGARYYAPWLGRWTSADPGGLGDGLDLFVYVRCNPMRFSDPTGNGCKDDIGAEGGGGWCPSEESASRSESRSEEQRGTETLRQLALLYHANPEAARSLLRSADLSPEQIEIFERAVYSWDEEDKQYIRELEKARQTKRIYQIEDAQGWGMNLRDVTADEAETEHARQMKQRQVEVHDQAQAVTSGLLAGARGVAPGAANPQVVGGPAGNFQWGARTTSSPGLPPRGSGSKVTSPKLSSPETTGTPIAGKPSALKGPESSQTGNLRRFVNKTRVKIASVVASIGLWIGAPAHPDAPIKPPATPISPREQRQQEGQEKAEDERRRWSQRGNKGGQEPPKPQR